MPGTSDCGSRGSPRSRPATAGARSRCCRPRTWPRLPPMRSPVAPYRALLSRCLERSSIYQEIDHQPIELRRVLDLCPMSALGEDVHASVRHRPRDLQPDIERTEAVIHAPNGEQLGLELVQIGPEVLARHLALALAEQLNGLGIDARLVALLKRRLVKERRVVENRLHQFSPLLAAGAATLVVARNHLPPFDRRGCKDRRDTATADDDDAR